MKNVKDIYALSPMQEIMLMHAVTHADDDVLFNQFCYEIHGELDTGAFEKSWQQLLDRHDILRSAFLWENLKSPIQVVREKTALPFEQLDWRGESESRRQSLLKQFCETDKKRGFDPRKAPLMRITLIQYSDKSHFFVWSSHHLLLDRWCLQIVFDELFKHYRSARDGVNADCGNPAQFREYIDWIKRQDKSKAAQFWQTYLAGYSEAVRLTTVAAGAESCTHSISLSNSDVAHLRRLATSSGVTLSILMQGAWSLTLNRLFNRQDVVFGAVVTGRPATLDGVESIIGSFVNNVPVRVPLPHDVSLDVWLKSLQQSQHQRGPFEYVAPTSIQRWSALPVGEPIFDTLIVTLGSTGVAKNVDFELVPLAGTVSTAYPLTLSIDESGHDLAVQAQLQPGHRCRIPLNELLNSYKTTLSDLASIESEAQISSLPGFTGSLTKTDLQVLSVPPLVAPWMTPEPVANQAGREEADIEIMQDLLRNEWQSVLGINDIGTDDDFFQLGGSSLQAATLHANVESATRKSLPILTLFRSTTLRGMAETLASSNWPLRSDLALGLRTTGSLKPLFCIASPEVNTVGYALLARYQDKDRPIYVLQAPPDGQSMRRLSPYELPGMATNYLRELRLIQPTGPYNLLGMCTGSQLVLEIARQLHEAGEQTVFAGIINTWAHYTVSGWFKLQRLLSKFEWYAMRLKEIWRLEPGLKLAEVRRVGNRIFSRVFSRNATISRNDATSAEGSDNTDAAAQSTRDPWIEDFGWAHKDPKHEKYPGTLTVFRIKSQQFWRTGEVDLGWSKHANRVVVEHLPGKTHEGVLREPHAKVIGQRIAEKLREANIEDAG
jgi:thioesterase domain-containing protein